MLERLEQGKTAVADQAAGLRRMLAPRRLRVLPVTGAANEQDQARIVTQLAGLLTASGRQVLLIDQTGGSAAAHWGLRARYELSHVLCGDRTWGQVLLEGPGGALVLPAARGLARLDTDGARQQLLSQLYALPPRPDIVLLNLASVPEGGALADPLGDWLFVATAGAGGLMPAYGQIKRLASWVRPRRLQVLVDGAEDAQDAQIAFGNLAATARRFLDLDLSFCGNVQAAVARHAAADAVPGALRQLASDMDLWRLRSYVPAVSPQLLAPKMAYATSPSWS